MQYAAAAGSNDVDVMKVMRDVLSTQKTRLYIPTFPASHLEGVTIFSHLLALLCRRIVFILSPVEVVLPPAVIS